MPEPPGSSWPDQVTAKLLEVDVAGSAPTPLVGRPASIVTTACLVGSIPWVGSASLTWSVAMDVFSSKVTMATLAIAVPVVRPALGWIM